MAEAKAVSATGLDRGRAATRLPASRASCKADFLAAEVALIDDEDENPALYVEIDARAHEIEADMIEDAVNRRSSYARTCATLEARSGRSARLRHKPS